MKHTAQNCVVLLLCPTEITLEHYVRKKWIPKSNTATEVVIGKLKVSRVDSHAINDQSFDGLTSPLMVYFGVCEKENESVFTTVLDSDGRERCR